MNSRRIPLHLRRLARSRGYTLTELMIVVSMIGVLAALAVVGYRKYVDSAKISEPLSIIQSIRSAEEEFKDKTMIYFDVSKSGYYPRASGFDSKKKAWNASTTHNDTSRWETLGVVVGGAVRFGYKVNSGAAGTAVNVPIDYQPNPTFPTPQNPWYIVQAMGDPNEDGKPTVLLSTSFSNGIAYNEDQ